MSELNGQSDFERNNEKSSGGIRKFVQKSLRDIKNNSNVLADVNAQKEKLIQEKNEKSNKEEVTR